MIKSHKDTLDFDRHNPKHFFGNCTRSQKLNLELTFETQQYLQKYFEALTSFFDAFAIKSF